MRKLGEVSIWVVAARIILNGVLLGISLQVGYRAPTRIIGDVRLDLFGVGGDLGKVRIIEIGEMGSLI